MSFTPAVAPLVQCGQHSALPVVKSSSLTNHGYAIGFLALHEARSAFFILSWAFRTQRKKDAKKQNRVRIYRIYDHIAFFAYCRKRAILHS
jgi:hypothetical protein